MYIFLARALRLGEYRELFVFGQPAHAQYPPVYPALLAVLGATFGERYGLFLATSVVLSGAALATVFATIRQRLGTYAGLAVLAACAVNPTLVHAAGVVRSEPLFLFLCAAALYAVSDPRPSRRREVVAIVASILATLTRTAGAPFIAAIFLTWLVRRRWRAAAALALAAALSVGSWAAWVMTRPQAALPDASYLADLKSPTDHDRARNGRIDTAVEQVRAYLTADLPSTLPVPTIPGTRIDNAFWLLVILFSIAAALPTLWKRWRPGLIATAAYAPVLVLWPAHEGRFLIPILPAIYAALFTGAARLGGLIRGGSALVPGVLAASIVAAGVTETAGELARAAQCDRSAALGSTSCFAPPQIAFFRALHYVASNSPAGAPFASSKEATAAFVTERPVIRVASLRMFAQDDPVAYLDRVGARFAVVGLTSGGDYTLARLLQPACHKLSVAAAFDPGTYVLRVEPQGAAGTSSACDATSSRLKVTEPLSITGLW
jgi:MFS family permease